MQRRVGVTGVIILNTILIQSSGYADISTNQKFLPNWRKSKLISHGLWNNINNTKNLMQVNL